MPKIIAERKNPAPADSIGLSPAIPDTIQLNTSLECIVNEFAEVRERLKDVEKFAGAMAQLSDATNLLAINASIRAAHADTDGKDFARVAGEVRTLAENSRYTAEAIRNIVTDIQSKMDREIIGRAKVLQKAIVRKR